MANTHKYMLGDSLWYCAGPDSAVLNVFINGYMHDDTPGGVPRYMVTCDTRISDEELPILESNLYRTELEAQSAKLHMLLRKGDAIRRTQLENEKAVSRQAAVITQLQSKKSVWEDVIHGSATIGGDYNNITVGAKGCLTLRDGAVVSKLCIESGGTCIVQGGAVVGSAKVQEGVLSVVGGCVEHCTMAHLSGRIEVLSGGDLHLTQISGGICTVFKGRAFGVIISHGTLLLRHQAAFATGVQVTGHEGHLKVYNGSAQDVQVDKGCIYIADGVRIQNLWLEAGGTVHHL